MPIGLRVRFAPAKISLLALVLMLMVACGQATNQVKRIETLKPVGLDTTQKVLLMPLDVELSLLTASGLLEPRADWTQAAKGFMNDSIIKATQKNNIELIDYSNVDKNPETVPVQLEKLHEAVGSSLIFDSMIPLPSRARDAVWSLGVDSQVLKEATGANYALFIYMRDSYASGGHVATSILLAVASGGYFVRGGGQQAGFASLVDLDSGDIVWFNKVASTSGDLRQAEPAATAIRLLLKDMPSANK